MLLMYGGGPAQVIRLNSGHVVFDWGKLGRRGRVGHCVGATTWRGGAPERGGLQKSNFSKIRVQF